MFLLGHPAGNRASIMAPVQLVRIVGGAMLAVAAVVVWFAMAPTTTPSSTPTDFSAQISRALADYEVNNSHADSAPKQQVVNGWVARDLLNTVARRRRTPRCPGPIASLWSCCCWYLVWL